MKYGDKYEFYEALQKQGEPSPLDDVPELDPAEALYYEDFFVLGSERVNGMGIGAIPIMKIMDYAIMESVVDVHKFKRIISALDRVYMKTVHDEQERKATAAKRKAKAKTR